MTLPVTQSSETSGTVSVMWLLRWPDVRVVGWWRWRMDKMEVVRDEVSGCFMPSCTLPSDPSSCCELSAHRWASNGGGGQDKLLKATLLDEGMEGAGSGWKESDRHVKWSWKLQGFLLTEPDSLYSLHYYIKLNLDPSCSWQDTAPTARVFSCNAAFLWPL